MRRSARLAVGVILATTAMSGLLIGTAPQPVRALVSLAVPDTLTMKHDRTAVVPAPGVMANDVVLLGATVQLVSGVSHGTVSLQSNGGYTYSPAAGYVGSDQFVYQLSGLVPTTATVTITLTNAVPVPNPDAYSFSGSTLMVAAPGVLTNDTDADGDALIAERVGGITGSLNVDPNGGFQYTPGGGFSGSATFSYRVSDGVAWSAPTTVTLTRPAPSPTPVPTPTPTPTPRPTPTPLPLPSLPVPSIPLPSIPLPTPPVPSPSVEVPLQPTPIPASLPVIGAAPGETPSPGGAVPGSGTDVPSGQAPDSINANRPDLSLNLPAIDLGTGTIGVVAGLEIWAVPAAVIGGPGLLVLLWISLQAGGAGVWIPAARRLRDDQASKRRRRSLRT
jgi:hypothetical protein